MATTTLTFEHILRLTADLLSRNGCDDANANAVGKVVAMAERDGCHSHGLMRISGYVAALKSGKVDGHARPTINYLTPSVIQVNAGGGFAPLAHQIARDELVNTTKRHGIAALSLVNMHHFAALWPEVESIVESDLCALACTSYKPAVIPAGGSNALYGTNPMAFGWPRQNEEPVIFDQASAVMARGEVMLAQREGRDLPPGVGINELGEPTTSPEEVLRGALLAFGGYKGSAIAMMVELLAGGLIGECFSFEAAQRDNNDGGPPQGGEFILALDPNCFGDASGWNEHCKLLFDKIEEQDGARLPSARRYKNRSHSEENGIEVSLELLQKIEEL